MKRPILFALEVAAGLILAAAGAWIANRLSHKANREAQALERIAAVAERAYPVRTLPQPSLYRADLKPIPAPDPEPCGDYVCGGDQISQAPKFGLNAKSSRLPGEFRYDFQLPIPGGAAVERWRSNFQLNAIGGRTVDR